MVVSVLARACYLHCVNIRVVDGRWTRWTMRCTVDTATLERHPAACYLFSLGTARVSCDTPKRRSVYLRVAIPDAVRCCGVRGSRCARREGSERTFSISTCGAFLVSPPCPPVRFWRVPGSSWRFTFSGLKRPACRRAVRRDRANRMPNIAAPRGVV